MAWSSAPCSAAASTHARRGGRLPACASKRRPLSVSWQRQRLSWRLPGQQPSSSSRPVLGTPQIRKLAWPGCNRRSTSCSGGWQRHRRALRRLSAGSSSCRRNSGEQSRRRPPGCRERGRRGDCAPAAMRHTALNWQPSWRRCEMHLRPLRRQPAWRRGGRGGVRQRRSASWRLWTSCAASRPCSRAAAGAAFYPAAGTTSCVVTGRP